MKEILYTHLPFITPEKVFLYFKDKNFLCWLDDCSKKKIRSYSIIGIEPFLIFISKKRKTSIFIDGKEEILYGNPFDIFKEVLKRYKVDFPFLFSPGALGYLSYDLGWHIEKLPDIAKDDLKIPEIWFGFYSTLLIFDHNRKKLIIVSQNVYDKNREFELKFKSLVEQFKKIFEKVENYKFILKDSLNFQMLSSNMTHNEYINSIKKIKNYIEKGDVYQINFAQRIQAKGIFSPEEIYLKLREINPTSFSGFLNTGSFYILSNSPELFLFKNKDLVITRPMKGTRPRGRNKQQDNLYKKQLLESAKDKAELIMIVDLERNDLGKVCKYGSVRVKKNQILEKYKTVFQTTSQIEGILKNDIDCIDLLKATFPGGSITGAPKIRAMEIIEELEPNKRGFYTGSMGYIGFNGNMELNILIRTILMKNDTIYYPVGGGIVWDSSPEKEYEETITKAKALFLTLGVKNDREFTKTLL